MSNILPGCDEVFERFFAPWYSAGDRERRIYHATRPDVEGWCPPRTPLANASPLLDEGQQQVVGYIKTMLKAAEDDWPTYLTIEQPLSKEWIEAFDHYWTREKVADLLDRSDPSDFSNDAVVIVSEFGAALGEVMRREEAGLEWMPDWPYWEAALLDVASGRRINVFHWAIKRFSDYGVEDGYVAKVEQCLHLVRNGWRD